MIKATFTFFRTKNFEKHKIVSPAEYFFFWHLTYRNVPVLWTDRRVQYE